MFRSTRQGWRLVQYRNGVEHLRSRPLVFGSASQIEQRKQSSSSSRLRGVFPKHDEFVARHIGPNDKEKEAMLRTIGLKVINRYCYCYFEEYNPF